MIICFAKRGYNEENEEQKLDGSDSILILLLSLAGCSREPQEAVEMDVNVDTLFSYPALIEDRIICKCFDRSTGAAFFMEISPNGKRFLGRIPNHYISTKFSVYQAPYLYLFAATHDETAELGGRNILFRINVEDGGVEQVEHLDDSVPGIKAHEFQGCIITIKDFVTEKEIKTLIESYDPEKDEWTSHMECSIDLTTGDGEAVHGLCANEDHIFVLHDICTSNGRGYENRQTESYIDVLNKNYEVEKTIKPGPEIQKLFFEARIKEMCAFGDYLYMYSKSNEAYLGRLEGDELIEVYSGENFKIAADASGLENPLFYTRDTRQVHMLNEEGELETIELQIESSSYQICMILTDQNACYIDCDSNKRNRRAYAYLVDRRDLATVTLPCRS